MGRGHVTGVLAEHAGGFRAWLLAEGYTEGSAARLVHVMAHLSRWMDGVGLSSGELTSPVIERFMVARRAEGYVGWRTAHALGPLVAYLEGIGVVARADTPKQLSELEELLRFYDSYLVAERDLAVASRRSYLAVARQFLAWMQEAEISLGSLSAATVSEFVRLECARRAPGSASTTTTGMRSLLRFLYVHGFAPSLLSAAVPSPARWALAGVPRYVGGDEVRALLDSCDRSSAVGRRDFAIVTVLVRLGLRAGEVARLELGDIDWHRGEVGVRVKGGRVERLPLPVDVGEAIVAWLRQGRPRRGATAVFCRLRAPHGALTAGGVSAVVRHASKRAGMVPIGAHRLRHTAATTMLHAGASLVEISRVLGHRRAPYDRHLREGRPGRPRRARRAVAGSSVMTGLAERVEEYLALRRALGFKLDRHGRLLPDFAEFCARRGEQHVTIDAAVAWARLPAEVSPTWSAERLRIVRVFARWLHALDPASEVPPTGLWAVPVRRPAPYLYSTAEVAALMAAARAEPHPLRAATFEALIGLLAVTGMRAGEAMGLDRHDLDLERSLLVVRNTKFGKTRLIPLHQSTLEALARYQRRRDRLCPSSRSPALFLSASGGRLRHSTVQPVFRRLLRRTGIGGDHPRRPRLHALRHSFAVRTLLRWQQHGVDVGAHLPALSTYLGHRDPANTYWYLSATPELLAHGAARLEATFEDQP